MQHLNHQRKMFARTNKKLRRNVFSLKKFTSIITIGHLQLLCYRKHLFLCRVLSDRGVCIFLQDKKQMVLKLLQVPKLIHYVKRTRILVQEAKRQKKKMEVVTVEKYQECVPCPPHARTTWSLSTIPGLLLSHGLILH